VSGYSSCDGDRSNGCERAVADCYVVAAAGQSRPGAIAVDDDNVYWANRGSLGSFGAGTVMKMPKTGGVPVEIASGLDDLGELILDATNVYVATSTSQGSVVALPK